MLAGALTALLAPAAAAAPCNTDSYGNNTHSRRLTSFALTDGLSTATINVNQSTKVYVDKTAEDPTTFTVGAELSFSSIVWNYEWMHSYFYIDYDNDGEYNTILNTDGSEVDGVYGELVSYSFYNPSVGADGMGTNSVGGAVKNDNGVKADQMPAFRLPANLQPGRYKCLFKIDWNNINPCGSGEIGSSGGCAVEFYIEVADPSARRITISSADETKGTVAFKDEDYAGQTEITVSGDVVVVATPAEGHAFVSWNRDTADGEQASTNPEFTVSGSTDVTLVANFVSFEEGKIVPPTTGDNIVQLSSLENLNKITVPTDQDSNVRVGVNRSTYGNAITIMGWTYQSGVGVHAPSVAYIALNGATEFHAVVGIDDEVKGNKGTAKHGEISYNVTAYGKDLTQSAVKAQGDISLQTDETYYQQVDVTGLGDYKYLKLEITKGADGEMWADHTDWANAYFVTEGELPEVVTEMETYPVPEVEWVGEDNDAPTLTPEVTHNGASVTFNYKVWNPKDGYTLQAIATPVDVPEEFGTLAVSDDGVVTLDLDPNSTTATLQFINLEPGKYYEYQVKIQAAKDDVTVETDPLVVSFTTLAAPAITINEAKVETVKGTATVTVSVSHQSIDESSLTVSYKVDGGEYKELTLSEAEGVHTADINITEHEKGVHTVTVKAVANDLNGDEVTAEEQQAGTFETPGTTGIDNVAADKAGNVRYFNLQGIEVKNPATGIYIKVEDGKASKVAL